MKKKFRILIQRAPSLLLIAGLFMVLTPIRPAADPIYVIDSDGNGSELVSLSGSSSLDPDGAIVDYEWRVNGVIAGQGYGPGVADLTHAFALGTSTVTLSLRDDALTTGTTVARIIVLDQFSNLRPTAHAVVPSTVSAPGGFTARFLVDASDSSDPENDPIFRYLWTEGADILYDGASATATIVLNGVGLHTVRLTVYSRDGNAVIQSGSEEFPVSVVEGTLDPAFLANRKWVRVVGKDFLFDEDFGEFSGITYNGLTNTYFMTDSDADAIYELRLDGTLIRAINIHELRASDEDEADAEGIAWMYENTYALVLEGSEEMIIAQITPATASLTRGGVTIYDLSGDPKGVTYDAEQDVLYWVSQDKPMRVVKARINSSTGRLETIFSRDMTGLPASDLGDVAYFPQLSPNLFLISQSTPVVVEVDVSREVPELISAFSTTPWPIPNGGGITFNPGGQMIIVGKRVGGLAEDDFNVFSPVEEELPTENFPLHPDHLPPVSLNYIHPGASSQEAEFYVDIKETGAGEITIYDLTGREVQSIRTPELLPGRYRAPWDLKNKKGEKISSGMYFVLIKTPTSARKEKLVVVW